MDTPTIAQYYREHDPMKRKALLDAAVLEEDSEENRIRRELWEIRYKEPQSGTPSRADGFLSLWMSMEFNKNAGNKIFGSKSACKEIRKKLEQLKFKELQEMDELHHGLLYRECCHMVKMYMELCETDRSYNSTLCGIMHISKEKAKVKLQSDIVQTAVELPKAIGMEEELAIVTKAAREMYEVHFPGEGGI